MLSDLIFKNVVKVQIELNYYKISHYFNPKYKYKNEKGSTLLRADIKLSDAKGKLC